jgi:hypothetical protein
MLLVARTVLRDAVSVRSVLTTTEETFAGEKRAAPVPRTTIAGSEF